MAYIASVMGPMLAALALSAAGGGPGGARELLRRIRWRFHPLWYLVAVGSVYAINFAGIGLYRIAGGEIGQPLPPSPCASPRAPGMRSSSCGFWLFCYCCRSSTGSERSGQFERVHQRRPVSDSG